MQIILDFFAKNILKTNGITDLENRKQASLVLALQYLLAQ